VPKTLSNRAYMFLLILLFTIGGGRSEGVVLMFSSYALLIWAVWRGVCMEKTNREGV